MTKINKNQKIKKNNEKPLWMGTKWRTIAFNGVKEYITLNLSFFFPLNDIFPPSPTREKSSHPLWRYPPTANVWYGGFSS